MSVSLKQASKFLNMTRNDVLDLVAAGKLKAERKRKRLSVDESDLGALLSQQKPETAAAASSRPRQVSLPEMLTGPLIERISELERQFAEKLDLLAENKRLALQLQQAHLDIAGRDTEIEKLRGDMVHQKKLLEKEIEDRTRLLDEKSPLIELEVSERVSREREQFETILQAERTLWSERIAHEQHVFEAEIAKLQAKQGLLARLMRMLTWS